MPKVNNHPLGKNSVTLARNLFCTTYLFFLAATSVFSKLQPSPRNIIYKEAAAVSRLIDGALAKLEPDHLERFFSLLSSA
jgi:hypothetical protein